MANLKYVIMFIIRTIKYSITRPQYEWWNINESRISSLQYSLGRTLVAIHAYSYLFLGAAITLSLIIFPISTVPERISLFAISLMLTFASYGVSGIYAPRIERNLLPRKYRICNRILSDPAIFRFLIFVVASSMIYVVLQIIKFTFFQ
jgi:hypothetical protein